MFPSKKPDGIRWFSGVGEYLSGSGILPDCHLLSVDSDKRRTNLVHHIIEPFDHMEGIDTDLCMGEILSCNRDKSVAPVAAEEFHPLALFRRELAEVLSDSAAGDPDPEYRSPVWESPSEMLQ